MKYLMLVEIHAPMVVTESSNDAHMHVLLDVIVVMDIVEIQKENAFIILGRFCSYFMNK